MIKVSSGTASVLNLNRVKLKAPPTTAYLMLGEKCLNNCKFCSQSRSSASDSDLLSRVEWREYPEINIFEHIENSFKEELLKRVCLQVIHSPDSMIDILDTVKSIKNSSSIPICSSASLNNVGEIDTLLNSGVDKVCLALDAANSKVYADIKGGSFETKLNLIKDVANKFPNKITTHLIVGLGETQEDMIRLIETMLDINITVALFAFTPVKGTPMENHQQPLIEHYRKVQIAHYLMKNKLATVNDMIFLENKLTKINLKDNNSLKQVLQDSNGLPFRTTGCADCNRPYYNERPRGQIYNYPKELTSGELNLAIKDSNLCSL